MIWKKGPCLIEKFIENCKLVIENYLFTLASQKSLI